MSLAEDFLEHWIYTSELGRPFPVRVILGEVFIVKVENGINHTMA